MFTQTFPQRILHMLTLTALGVVLLAVVLPTYAAPLHAPFASPRFEQVWNLTDKAVAEGRATRSWTWGP